MRPQARHREAAASDRADQGQKIEQSLTVEKLYNWHRLLFPSEGAGEYRVVRHRSPVR